MRRTMSAPLHLALLVAAQDSSDDRFLSQLIGANLGGLIVLLAYVRRLRAARSGRRLEQHFMYRAAPVYYAGGWLLVLGFIVALVRRDEPATVAFVLTASFSALWIASGLVLRSDRNIERREGTT